MPRYGHFDIPLPFTLANRGGPNSDGALVGTVTVTSATKVFTYDASATTFADETTDAASAATGDVTFPDPFDTGDIIYIGYTHRFFGWQAIVGTQGAGDAVAADLVHEYYNGSSWATIESGFEFIDDSVGFTTGASTYIQTFVPPPLWAKTTINSSEQYWIRIRAADDDVWNTTQPVLSRLRVLPLNVGESAITAPSAGIVDSVALSARTASATNNDTELLLVNITQGKGAHVTWTGADVNDTVAAVTELAGGAFKVRRGDEIALYCLAEDGTTEFADGNCRVNLR